VFLSQINRVGQTFSESVETLAKDLPGAGGVPVNIEHFIMENCFADKYFLRSNI
jgi:hypothetical protein